MQTTPLHLRYESSSKLGWASVGVARAAGVSTELRGLSESVLAKGLRAALLVASPKSGCHEHRGFGRVNSVAVCTGIGLICAEGGAPRAVATASVRSNPALKRDVPQAARPLALRWASQELPLCT